MEGNDYFCTKEDANTWRMIYCLMDNVKMFMDFKLDEYKGKITKDSINEVLEYLNKGIDEIKKVNKN